ncbi:putative selenium-dependent hydroxylase accessory protein YqeC [Desulfosporosinus sp. BICA1-9]|uniref:putative selenium-dependent hydroxylase accessory protein YqeC n=1 Tax=Desulfosporosinus sp. BICA1-9 TaxID=1531958 RepID=UPI00054BA464|nr:putative selenium-dependent hydroxylase accessory protein YqeC [Desulfosporosinus sp. BICA1-9]KJS88053.1 MAG: hydroxylase [Desulfosporosinus sp. BICA1-9]
MTSSDIWSRNGCISGSLWDMIRRVQVVTFIGAGGKTTCLRSITQELKSAGQQVIATTTTKVFPEQHMNIWKSADPPEEQDGACFWYVTVEDKSGKWIGPSVEAVDAAIDADRLSLGCHASPGASVSLSVSLRIVPNLHKRFWVIEGDGARGLRLKCWESHEPQIPLRSDCAVLVLDRGLWGNVLQPDQVHRSKRCADLIGRVLNAESAWRYFLRSPVFAPQYENLSWVIFLNSPRGLAETPDLTDNHELVRDIDLLRDLSHKWAELKAEANHLKQKPIHLRLAVGNAKEGVIQWCDLW